ncbi:hypothetical protein VARIO8X_20146 [Burkholderiales bacterium 8X]|nr:hypothetical protein VARIO8X_20146 [Burkholderiales bacterium 8X]
MSWRNLRSWIVGRKSKAIPARRLPSQLASRPKRGQIPPNLPRATVSGPKAPAIALGWGVLPHGGEHEDPKRRVYAGLTFRSIAQRILNGSSTGSPASARGQRIAGSTSDTFCDLEGFLS